MLREPSRTSRPTSYDLQKNGTTSDEKSVQRQLQTIKVCCGFQWTIVSQRKCLLQLRSILIYASSGSDVVIFHSAFELYLRVYYQIKKTIPVTGRGGL
jgi:hypothetical protein